MHIYRPSLKAATFAMFMVWLQTCKMLIYFRTNLHLFLEYLSDMLENWRKVNANVAFFLLLPLYILIECLFNIHWNLTQLPVLPFQHFSPHLHKQQQKIEQSRCYNQNFTSDRGEIISEPLWCLRFTSLLSVYIKRGFVGRRFCHLPLSERHLPVQMFRSTKK